MYITLHFYVKYLRLLRAWVQICEKYVRLGSCRFVISFDTAAKA
jgi:hypothetical protein